MKSIHLIGLCALVGLGACGSEQASTSAAATAAKPKVDAGTPAAAAPAVPTPVREPYVYAYSPVSKRDPFRNMVDMSDPTEKVAGGPCADPLCQFDLDQLTLVAVVSGDANPLAMVEDPSKTGYLVRRNSKIGKQGGKVTQIARDCLEVTEFFEGPDGKVNPNRTKVCVKQDAKQKPPMDLMQGAIFK
jgi:type IV pilus assembly protein PilP